MALRVRDNDSLSSIQTASATIANVLPTADANGPYEGTAETAVTFGGVVLWMLRRRPAG